MASERRPELPAAARTLRAPPGGSRSRLLRAPGTCLTSGTSKRQCTPISGAFATYFRCPQAQRTLRGTVWPPHRPARSACWPLLPAISAFQLMAFVQNCKERLTAVSECSPYPESASLRTQKPAARSTAGAGLGARARDYGYARPSGAFSTLPHHRELIRDCIVASVLVGNPRNAACGARARKSPGKIAFYSENNTPQL